MPLPVFVTSALISMGVLVAPEIGVAAALGAAAPVLLPVGALFALFQFGGSEDTDTDEVTDEDTDEDADEDSNEEMNEVLDQETTRGVFDEENRSFRITVERMRSLLDRRGPDIYRSLKKPTSRTGGQAWKGLNFKIETGTTVPGHDKVQYWSLKLSRNANESTMASVNRCSLHDELFWGTFNFKNPPKYDAWKADVLTRLQG